MLNQLSISNFKCFSENQAFDLRPLNVFTGLNGRGKSSVFQALLLLSQSLHKNGDIEYLCVNGNFVNLDLFEDIINDAKRKVIQFNIGTDNPDIKEIKLGYKEDFERERAGVISELQINGKNYFEEAKSLSKTDTTSNQSTDSFLIGYPKELVNNIFKDYYFVSADRLGPTRDERKADRYNVNPLGIIGEHRLNTLNSKEIKLNSVSFDKKQGKLKEEVEKWLSYIMDGAKIKLQGTNKQDSVLQLFLSNNDNCKEEIKSINFGFGYSYVISVIITSLIAQKGSCVFVENPEAHLHPRAQSRLTELLCKLAESGVQVFIETHSEHILNRVRLSTLKDDIKLTNKDISFYYFGENFEITKLELDKNAQFVNDNCLEGFFDQQEIELAEILKLGLLK